MISHGVEISIAGWVGEIVRDTNPAPFFIFFIFIMCLLFLGTRSFV